MKLSTQEAHTEESKEDLEFMLEDYESDDGEQEGGKEFIEKIYYASRKVSRII